jgi:polyphosphate kinase 2 (PPK2 family)
MLSSLQRQDGCNVPRLNQLPMDRTVPEASYKNDLATWQYDLLSLQQAVLRQGGRMIVVAQGMDAAGKGGAIKRLVQRLDPRSFRVYRIGAPSSWKQEKHYLYRFWTRLPSPGELIIFDRSWYERVLVERVEGLTEVRRWQQAYREIREFERWLVDDGIMLCKLWFHIDSDVQLGRFRARENDPHKAWKLTDEDWRNRDQWDRYIEAAEDLFEQTDTEQAPWTIIPANCKRHARLIALQTVADRLAREAVDKGIETLPLNRAGKNWS